jgi:hypothetical protein
MRGDTFTLIHASQRLDDIVISFALLVLFLHILLIYHLHVHINGFYGPIGYMLDFYWQVTRLSIDQFIWTHSDRGLGCCVVCPKYVRQFECQNPS